MNAPNQHDVPPLAQRLAGYPELWQVVDQQIQQPHFLVNFLATLQVIDIALFIGKAHDDLLPPPMGFLTGVLYFEIALALDSYTSAQEKLVWIFENEQMQTDADSAALLQPGVPLAVAHRVMAEPIERGVYSAIAFDFYGRVIALCIRQRRSRGRGWQLAARFKNLFRAIEVRQTGSLEAHRIAWDAGEVDHIEALAHWQRATHALALARVKDASAEFARCASIAAAAQARGEMAAWPAECIAAANAGAAGESGDFSKAIGSYVRRTAVIPWSYYIA